jgi:hypothetical protein
MNDITIIYLTVNEVPNEWQEFQIETLKKAIGDTPVISISRKSMDFGDNYLQFEDKSCSNVYRQILRGAKLAKTEYIAIAEDDSLYPEDHFRYRPAKGVVGYNMSHWSLFNWGEPIYNWRNRRGGYTMIAERQLVIDALEERFHKYPNGIPESMAGEIGRERVEKQMGVTVQKVEEFTTNTPIINICHDNGLDDRARRHRKNLGTLRAYDIPYWGKASDLIIHFK